MRYELVREGIFLSRPNRFIAEVEVDGHILSCHVKNTGRLGELFLPGVCLALCPGQNPKRKTPYDVIAVQKAGQWVNIDSQIINSVFGEWAKVRYPHLKPEVTFGNSRFDFLLEENHYAEVKGVTLLDDGCALFPDAPTLRGEKHLQELAEMARNGLLADAVFVAAIPGARCIRPHPERESFGRALREAKNAGVRLMGFSTLVTRDTICIGEEIPVIL